MSTSNPAAPEPSEIAGRFQVVQKLGAGAFGTVYKARDKVLGRMLAIKTIRLEGLAASQASLGELLDRFKREAQVAAQLKHPNIVTIYDIGESEGFSYLSMEFIDGVGLDRVIAEAGRLPVERTAALASQVADALDYAHRHGVVHRDIKPANIMIEPGDRVKVADFGIAKVTDSAEHLTMTGSLLGTPSYMSPEQARGTAVDGRSDLFSLGCVLYEMVAGRKAFRGESITALLFKILTEEPSPLREIEPTVPESLTRIIAKALAKSPEARYQTGRELSDDLLGLTRPGAMPTLRSTDAPTISLDSAETLVSTPAGQPATDASATLAHGTATSSTRPASSVPLAATVLTPATATQRPARSAPAAPARPPRTAASEKKGGGSGWLLALGLVGILGLAAVGVAGWLLMGRRTPAPAPQPSPAVAPTTPVEAPETTGAVPPAGAGTPGSEAATPVTATTLATSVDARSVKPRSGADLRQPLGATPLAHTEAATSSGAPAPSAGGDFSFLDELPDDSADGRAAGDAVAQKYRSGPGGSPGYANSRFARRGRFPRGLTPLERPAAATLAYLLFSEEAYQRTNGRYGTLQDLRSAGLLRLDVRFGQGGFDRRGYRFQFTGDASEFKVTATPLAMGGRPLLVDDSGFVRFDE